MPTHQKQASVHGASMCQGTLPPSTRSWGPTLGCLSLSCSAWGTAGAWTTGHGGHSAEWPQPRSRPPSQKNDSTSEQVKSAPYSEMAAPHPIPPDVTWREKLQRGSAPSASLLRNWPCQQEGSGSRGVGQGTCRGWAGTWRPCCREEVPGHGQGEAQGSTVVYPGPASAVAAGKLWHAALALPCRGNS